MPLLLVVALSPQPPMTMPKKIALSVCALACACVAALGADPNPIRAEASRSLRLAVVDGSRKAAGHDALHAAFGEALAFELGQRGKEVPVKVMVADPDRAAWGLANGSFDVGLIVGNNVPRAVISSEFELLKATQTDGKGKFALYLVLRKDDPELSRILASAFPESLKGQFFLWAVAKANGQDAPENWKLSVAAN